jgi:hypothetical protein
MEKTRFEVEDITSRKNYTFVLTKRGVDMYNTSRGFGNSFMGNLGQNEFINLGIKDEYSPEKHFKMLYEKSLKPNPQNVYFIGWVDNKFNPIEE